VAGSEIDVGSREIALELDRDVRGEHDGCVEQIAVLIVVQLFVAM
jgi:hypothetical protein